MMDQKTLMGFIPQALHYLVQEVNLYGSHYVGGDAVHDESDFDVLVLPKEGFVAALVDELLNMGFEGDCDEVYDGSGFLSIRKRHVNLIVAQNQIWYENSQTAMELCRELKVTDKAQRILIHDVVVRKHIFSPKTGWCTDWSMT